MRVICMIFGLVWIITSFFTNSDLCLICANVWIASSLVGAK